MQDARDEAEMDAHGSAARELRVGDLVIRRLGPTQHRKQAGSKPLRLTRSVDPVIYRVTQSVGGQPFAYRIVDHLEPSLPLAFPLPVSRRHLIKLDMPELNHHGGREQRRLEVLDAETGEWRKGTQDALGLDGRALIRWDDASPDRACGAGRAAVLVAPWRSSERVGCGVGMVLCD